MEYRKYGCDPKNVKIKSSKNFVIGRTYRTTSFGREYVNGAVLVTGRYFNKRYSSWRLTGILSQSGDTKMVDLCLERTRDDARGELASCSFCPTEKGDYVVRRLLIYAA